MSAVTNTGGRKATAIKNDIGTMITKIKPGGLGLIPANYWEDVTLIRTLCGYIEPVRLGQLTGSKKLLAITNLTDLKLRFKNDKSTNNEKLRMNDLITGTEKSKGLIDLLIEYLNTQ